MKRLIIILLFTLTIIILQNNNLFSYDFKTLKLTNNTTPRSIYEQLGVSGSNISDEMSHDLVLVWDCPMIVYGASSVPISICPFGCDGASIIVTFENNKKKNSFLQNVFPGIFGNNWIISDIIISDK